jgi:thiol-disulfide isomerase/thioredoxin
MHQPRAARTRQAPGRGAQLQEGIVMNAYWRAPAGLHTASARLPVEGELPSFDGATGWLNSPPLTPAGLRGKVVLVDFWTYTCINWLRQLPYVRAWAGKYSGLGLVVIGVHTPEFSFEHNADNVRQAVQEMRITYPVATDNDYAVWRAFGNHYWPALYFADAQGRIRHHHFGEGEYGQSEMVIQQLLAETESAGAGTEMVSVDPSGLEAPADWGTLRSPENYTGYERTENFATPGGPVPGTPHVYTVPARLGLNQWTLSGDWTMGDEAATLNAAGGQIACRFHARDLNLVMGPTAPGSPVRCRVLIDGQPPGEAHGTDVDGDGNGNLMQQRVYQLIRQPGPITDRTFEITFSDPRVQAYCFTFG